MYIPKYFNIEELVNPFFHQRYPEGLLWSRFHPHYLVTLDKLRTRYGSIVINDGEYYVDSGARVFNTNVGAAFSMHKLWAAFDLKFMHADPVEVMEDIVANYVKWPVIGRMEDARVTKSWLHIDFGNRRLDQEIYIFKP